MEQCMPYIPVHIDKWGRLSACVTIWMLHVSCAFRLQTETTSVDMDDCDGTVIQNTDTQCDVSITNISENTKSW